jgi:hypothetical protein
MHSNAGCARNPDKCLKLAAYSQYFCHKKQESFLIGAVLGLQERQIKNRVNGYKYF